MVWRWMKHELTILPNPPTSTPELKRILQELWDRVNPEDWRYLTERLTRKLKDVIAAKGI
jgi:hypothetical protein